jgi:TIR domain
MSTKAVHAFISYAHVDRAYAGQTQSLLREFGVSAFLAHEDLEVSDEWCTRLLLELAHCDLFVALFSKHYLASTWAQQESGFIASRLREVVVAPLSLDGTRSAGFLAHIQSPSVGPDGVTRALLVQPLAPRFPRVILRKTDRTSGPSGLVSPCRSIDCAACPPLSFVHSSGGAGVCRGRRRKRSNLERRSVPNGVLARVHPCTEHKRHSRYVTSSFVPARASIVVPG